MKLSVTDKLLPGLSIVIPNAPSTVPLEVSVAEELPLNSSISEYVVVGERDVLPQTSTVNVELAVVKIVLLGTPLSQVMLLQKPFAFSVTVLVAVVVP